MAFISMVFGGAAIILLVVLAFLALVFFTVAIILKVIGKHKDKKGLRITGNVFLAFGILNIVPVLLVVFFIIFNLTFTSVTRPDGSKAYVSSSKVNEMNNLIAENSDNSIDELEQLLSDNPNLVYYLDANLDGVLEKGWKTGNARIVEIALENGAVFDNPQKYEHMAHAHGSIEDYLSYLLERSLTDDDVRIIELMFENNASTDTRRTYNGEGVYSNLFGEAVWNLLYNDETVTDTELAFLQVFIDNGLSSDDYILLHWDIPSNYHFSPDIHFDVLKDDNYHEVMTIIGR